MTNRWGVAVVVTGQVRWFDPDRGIGLLGRDSGGDVVVHATALPAGTTALPIGTRVQFDVGNSPRGPVAVDVTVVAYPAPRRPRRSPEGMITLLEDLIRVLDRTSDGYRHGRRPIPTEATTLAGVLRAVADDLDV